MLLLLSLMLSLDSNPFTGNENDISRQTDYLGSITALNLQLPRINQLSSEMRNDMFGIRPDVGKMRNIKTKENDIPISGIPKLSKFIFTN